MNRLNVAEGVGKCFSGNNALQLTETHLFALLKQLGGLCEYEKLSVISC